MGRLSQKVLNLGVWQNDELHRITEMALNPC